MTVEKSSVLRSLGSHTAVLSLQDLGRQHLSEHPWLKATPMLKFTTTQKWSENPPHPPWFEGARTYKLCRMWCEVWHVVQKPHKNSNQKSRAFSGFEKTWISRLVCFPRFTHRCETRSVETTNTQPNFVSTKIFLIYTNKGIIISLKWVAPLPWP